MSLGYELASLDSGERGINVLERDPRIATEQARRNDGAILHEVVWEERLRGEEALPDAKQDNHQEAKDDHADDHGRGPTLFLVCCETERQEKEGEAPTD